MKKFILISVIVLLMAMLAIYVSLNRPQTDVRLIKLKGTTVANFSKGYFNIISGLNKDSLSAVPAGSNDLLYVMDEEGDFEFLYQPWKQDGDFLKFKTDSFGIFLGGNLISLMLSPDNGSLEWLKNSTREQISFLRSLVIADSLTENCLPGIKRIAESGIHPGMLISKDQKITPELIRLIKPVWIYTGDDGSDSIAINAIYETKNLELLALEKVKINFSRLSGLPKLKSLILSGPDSVTVSQLDRLPDRIFSLQIIDSKLKDLYFLKPSSKLKELNLIYSDLQNIESLRNCEGLEVLSLIDCDSVPDLNPLSALHQLKWLAPPWNINDQDLETIVRNSPEIETLVLYDCKYLKSLAPLKRLPKLSNLSLMGTSIEPDSLVQFQKLKYLCFHSDQDTDSLNIIKLQSKMPGTLVVPAEPFCMGSGWILVFFLLLIAGCSAYIGFKKGSFK